MAFFEKRVEECDRLNGFAQTHLIGEDRVNALAP